MKSIIKALYIFLVIIASSGFLAASNQDSLWAIWHDQTQHDTSRLDALRKVQLQLMSTHLDTVFVLSPQMIKLASDIKDYKRLAQAYRLFGTAHFYVNQMDSASIYYERTIEAARTADNFKEVVMGYYNLKYVYDHQGRSKEWYQLVLPLLEEARERKDKFNTANLLDAIANYHFGQSNYPKMIEAARESADIFKEIGTMRRYGRVMYLMSAAYGQIQEWEKNKDILKTVIPYFEASKDYAALTASQSSLGMSMIHLGDTLAGLEQMKKPVLLSKEMNMTSNLISSGKHYGEYLFLCGQVDSAMAVMQVLYPLVKDYKDENIGLVSWIIGACHLHYGNVNDAIRSCRKSYEISKARDDFYLLSKTCNCLASAERQNKNYSTALQYAEEYGAIMDSVYNDKNSKKITGLTMQYEFDKEKQALVFEQKEKENRLQAQARQSRMGAAGISVLALLGFGFFWNTRRKNKIIASQNQQLELLNNTKDHIFAIIGHDLRKPALAFRGITDKVNYLLREKDYERLNKLGQSIEKEAIALNRLTDNLLNWALMQRNVMPHKPEQITLRPLVQDVIALFENVAAKKNIRLITDIDANTQLLADKDTLQIIIRNLVDNAIKYTPENGTVTINALSENEHVTLAVKDTGVGIPEELLSGIFMLQNGKSQRGTSGEKGTGLGLHLVSELVKMNKGFVDVASQLGKGTTFRLSFPVR